MTIRESFELGGEVCAVVLMAICLGMIVIIGLLISGNLP